MPWSLEYEFSAEEAADPKSNGGALRTHNFSCVELVLGAGACKDTM